MKVKVMYRRKNNNKYDCRSYKTNSVKENCTTKLQEANLHHNSGKKCYTKLGHMVSELRPPRD
jgi:hypothetical protein